MPEEFCKLYMKTNENGALTIVDEHGRKVKNLRCLSVEADNGEITSVEIRFLPCNKNYGGIGPDVILRNG